MNKKGFTLVELLSVIVILAVILVIAIPQIINVIKQSRISTFKDSAILIATNAEKDYLSNQVLDPDYDVSSIPCEDVAKLNEDYSYCDITYDNKTATVTLVGNKFGKFQEITCIGTKDNMICSQNQGNKMPVTRYMEYNNFVCIGTDTDLDCGNWDECAAENATCNFSTSTYVRYGAKEKWNYGYYNESVKCANSEFKDPIYGTVKKCYILQ